MCPVWKPLHEPPKLSPYSYLSDDAQRIISVLENKYQNQHSSFSQCHVKTDLTDSLDAASYYRSIYESRYKTELHPGSFTPGTKMSSHYSNTSINSIYHTQPDIKPDSQHANPFHHPYESPQQCGILQTSSHSLQISEHSKNSHTPMSSRNCYSYFNTPEVRHSLINDKTDFHTTETFINSFTFGSELNKTTLGGAVSDNRLSKSSLQEQINFESSGDSITKSLFKIPAATKPCLNKTSPYHNSENKSRNMNMQGGIKTCQMRITESLKQMLSPPTSDNMAKQSSPIPSCFYESNRSSSRHFHTQDAEAGSKIVNVHLSATSSPSTSPSTSTSPSKESSNNTSPVLFESLTSVSCNGENECDKQLVLDFDFLHEFKDTLCDHPHLSPSKEELMELHEYPATINVLQSERFCHNTTDVSAFGTRQGFQVVDDKMAKPCIKRSSKLSKGTSHVNTEQKPSKKRQSTFQTPLKNKKSRDDMTPNTISYENDVHASIRNPPEKSVDVISLSEPERKQLATDIVNSTEICMTLVFSDNSTLLSHSHSGESTKKHGSLSKKITHLAMKITLSNCLNDCKSQNVLLFSLDNESPGFQNWLRLLLKDLISNSVPQKIAVNAKDVFVELLRLTYLVDKQSSCWFVLDPTVGAWLLNSEKSVHSLTDVLLVLGMDSLHHIESSSWIDNLNTEFTLLHKVMTTLEEKLKRQDLWKLFSEVECPLISLLATMEVQQLKVDTKTFITFSDVLKTKLSRLEEKAFSIVGHSFCINSHPQLRQVLYEELRLDKKLPLNTKIAKTCIAQQKSTSEVMLSQLVEIHPLPAIVLEYRQLQKLKSTYVDGMLACVEDGYLRTHWDQTAAATGRLTSFQPNIQAIPKTSVTVTEYEISYIAGKNNDAKIEIFVREPYVSHEGHVLLAADFQQIELRLLAHLSDDPILLEMFRTNTSEDIFIQLTAQWLKKATCEVTAIEREQTKRIVYSVMYGVGKEKLSEYLKVSPDNAKAIMQSFLLKFPAVNRFTKKCVEFCQEHGYTATIFKRRRQIPHINHPSYQMRAQASRQAVNFCVQGSAADLCKAAMLKVEKELKSQPNIHTKLLVQIHDELVWEVPQNELNAVKDIVKAIMEDRMKLCGEIVELNVPIKISLSVGNSWAHLKHV